MRRHLSNSEIRQLLSAVDLGSPFGRRDYLLIMFLYHTGLRVGECSRLLVRLVSRDGLAFESLDLPAMFGLPHETEKIAR
jgi:integrase